MITARGWFVLGIVAGIVISLLIAGAWQLASHLWWTGGGWCWGTFTECFNR